MNVISFLFLLVTLSTPIFFLWGIWCFCGYDKLIRLIEKIFAADYLKMKFDSYMMLSKTISQKYKSHLFYFSYYHFVKLQHANDNNGRASI